VFVKNLEHFYESCSDVPGDQLIAVFLIFGFRLRQGYGGQVVSARSHGFSNLFLHRSLAKNQKSSLHIATSFLSML